MNKLVKVLLTGMSGVGKSTVLNQIKSDGHQVVDLDYGHWIVFDDSTNDYIMDSEKIIDYIEQNKNKDLFFSGTTMNQKEIYPYLDFIIVLTAPLEVMKQRIQLRENNNFGKSEEDWQKIMNDKAIFEPLIIKSSNYTIPTDKAVSDVVKEIYEFLEL